MNSKLLAPPSRANPRSWEVVQVFVGPAHGKLHHVVQLRNRDLLGNQESPPDRRADAS
jgi:hypothetical protein